MALPSDSLLKQVLCLCICPGLVLKVRKNSECQQKASVCQEMVGEQHTRQQLLHQAQQRHPQQQLVHRARQWRLRHMLQHQQLKLASTSR
jgi:hypothetical protein